MTAFWKPDYTKERAARKLAVKAEDRASSAVVGSGKRSGGRCEVRELQGMTSVRCGRGAIEVHHMIGGRGKRGRGASATAECKQHVCTACHQDITGGIGGRRLILLAAPGDVPNYLDVYMRAAMRKAARRYWRDVTPEQLHARRAGLRTTLLSKPPRPRSGNVYSRTKSGKRADLGGQFFRSAWEANYARYLNWLIARGKLREWSFEPRTFVFHGVTRGVLTYTPDFLVVESDGSSCWHEVKGWMDAKSKAKLKRFAKFYPDERLIVIGATEYKALSKWSGLIPGWE